MPFHVRGMTRSNFGGKQAVFNMSEFARINSCDVSQQSKRLRVLSCCAFFNINLKGSIF